MEMLREYPLSMWGVEPTERWLSLCNQLQNYTPPPKSLELKNKERKWEMVSSFQKSIRRGDLPLALSMVSAMSSMPEEWPYFWRRMSVVAIEDVGPADRELVLFVMACSTLYTPKKTGQYLYNLFCYLVAEICSLDHRSRVYCTLTVIEHSLKKITKQEDYQPFEWGVLTWIDGVEQVVDAAGNQMHTWLKKNGWRGDGLLKFIDFDLPFDIKPTKVPLSEYKQLYGLPSCGYDMYTRVGRAMIKKLISVNVKIAKLLHGHQGPGSSIDIVGESLFFVEGGRIRGELINPELYWFEQKMMARAAGFPFEKWIAMRVEVEESLRSGMVDSLRLEALKESYG